MPLAFKLKELNGGENVFGGGQAGVRSVGNLGKFYLSALNDTAKAIDYLRKAIELDPASSGNYFSLARLFRKQGLREKALDVYLSAEGMIGN